MEKLEIEACLASMVILIDTREQPSARAERRYKSFSVPYRRQKLDYGDYSAEFTDINGMTYQVPAAIERKMNLEELSSCFCHSRQRFEAEWKRASADKAHMYLLVENASWENLINGRYKTGFNPKAFLASITAWMVRFSYKLIFCKSETSGVLIQEILYRELKELLESGYYG